MVKDHLEVFLGGPYIVNNEFSIDLNLFKLYMDISMVQNEKINFFVWQYALLLYEKF